MRRIKRKGQTSTLSSSVSRPSNDPKERKVTKIATEKVIINLLPDKICSWWAERRVRN
jgi:hypothetical protein